jgi:hypothetical protein
VFKLRLVSDNATSLLEVKECDLVILKAGRTKSEFKCFGKFRPGGEKVVGVAPFEPTKSWTGHEKRDVGKALLRWCVGQIEVLFGLEDPIERVGPIEGMKGDFGWFGLKKIVVRGEKIVDRRRELRMNGEK